MIDGHEKSPLSRTAWTMLRSWLRFCAQNLRSHQGLWLWEWPDGMIIAFWPQARDRNRGRSCIQKDWVQGDDGRTVESEALSQCSSNRSQRSLRRSEIPLWRVDLSWWARSRCVTWLHRWTRLPSTKRENDRRGRRPGQKSRRPQTKKDTE